MSNKSSHQFLLVMFRKIITFQSDIPYEQLSAMCVGSAVILNFKTDNKYGCNRGLNNQ